jgi:hypothetical protein
VKCTTLRNNTGATVPSPVAQSRSGTAATHLDTAPANAVRGARYRRRSGAPRRAWVSLVSRVAGPCCMHVIMICLTDSFELVSVAPNLPCFRSPVFSTSFPVPRAARGGRLVVANLQRNSR